MRLIDADELISMIERHKENVRVDDPFINEVYDMAIDNTLRLIEICTLKNG